MALNFNTLFKTLMADYNLGVKDTSGLSGEELDEVLSNNEAMEQLFVAVADLHEKCLASVAPATVTAPKKRARAPPKKKVPVSEEKVVSEDDEDEDKTATATDSEEEKPAKKKRAPAKKKAGPKAPKAPSAYSMFTSHIIKMNKGEAAGSDVKVKVSLADPAEMSQALLLDAKAAELVATKDQEKTVGELLKMCKDLLTSVDGKIHVFRLSSLMWAAVGNKSPF